ncbi:MAG: hypothetical protein K2Q03_07890 [Sphingobacteriaceae bacterium]|nr:hypothetical protein [Sphingobacteriaceae bacterium]
MLKKYILVLFICSIYSFAHAQKNYFHAGMKLPFGEVLLGVLDVSLNLNQDPANRRKDEVSGGGLDFGYGIHLKNNWYLETGVEFFAGQSLSKTYDYPSVFVSRHKIDFSNYALSIPAKLVYRLEQGDHSFWHFSLGLGFQNVFSKGYKYTYEKYGDELRMIKDENFGTKHTFNVNIQPAFGFFFDIGERSQVGLDVSYLTINWDKNMAKFSAPDQFNLAVPTFKISDAFATIKFLF